MTHRPNTLLLGTTSALVLLVGLAAAPARAQSPVRLELLAGTTAPLDVGARARLVLLDRVLLDASAGAGAYGDLFGAIAEPLGGAEAATVARGLADGAFVGRLSLGLRPFGDGLELVFGYTVIQRSTTFEAGTFGAQTPAVHAELLLHALHGELAGTFAIGDFLIRPAIGWTQAIGSEVGLASERTGRRIDAALAQTEADMESAIATYAMTPTVSLGVGYRF
ncbi:MAG: hypothetical protein H6719_20185 [Sandaracinaceae bacterium]|nr:hypothetical protein [Sandaracinaceae bacterium]